MYYLKNTNFWMFGLFFFFYFFIMGAYFPFFPIWLHDINHISKSDTGIIFAAISLFCGFIWLPMQLPVLWAMVCGLGLGGAFPLCLLLALDHSVQPAIAGKLVAFMQGIGFIIAGLAPWFSGVLRSISGNYLMDWAFHALCVVGLMIITLRFAPVRFPQLWVKEA
jgi:cyanate permease